MRAFTGDHNFLPNFIEAPTASSLFRKIRSLQAADGAEYRFINFYFDPSTSRHIAWFYKLNDNKEELQEIINGTSKE